MLRLYLIMIQFEYKLFAISYNDGKLWINSLWGYMSRLEFSIMINSLVLIKYRYHLPWSDASEGKYWSQVTYLLPRQTNRWVKIERHVVIRIFTWLASKCILEKIESVSNSFTFLEVILQPPNAKKIYLKDT